jgi:hypothetical protein
LIKLVYIVEYLIKLLYIVWLKIKKFSKIELSCYNACLRTFTGNLASFNRIFPKLKSIALKKFLIYSFARKNKLWQITKDGKRLGK